MVTVLEKNNFTGGRCSLLHKDGYVSPLCLLLLLSFFSQGESNEQISWILPKMEKEKNSLHSSGL